MGRLLVIRRRAFSWCLPGVSLFVGPLLRLQAGGKLLRLQAGCPRLRTGKQEGPVSLAAGATRSHLTRGTARALAHLGHCVVYRGNRLRSKRMRVSPLILHWIGRAFRRRQCNGCWRARADSGVHGCSHCIGGDRQWSRWDRGSVGSWVGGIADEWGPHSMGLRVRGVDHQWDR